MMVENTFGTVESNNIKLVKEIANKLILILEDIIEIVSDRGDVTSENIKVAKEKASDAKKYLLTLKENIWNSREQISRENLNLYNKELEIYNNGYIDDIITSWLLNGTRDTVMDSLYIACYRVRELLRKL